MELIKTDLEKQRALSILEDAFKSSLGITWLLKGKTRKKNHLFLSYLLEESMVNKGAFITKDYNGVVLYSKIECRKTSIQLIIKKAYLFLFVLGVKNGYRGLKYRRLVNGVRPKNGWCGWLVATDQAVVGNEAAYEIKNEMFRIAEATNEAVFVETTTKRVKLLYERAGYYVYNQIKHPYEELVIWFLRRDPIIKY